MDADWDWLLETEFDVDWETEFDVDCETEFDTDCEIEFDTDWCDPMEVSSYVENPIATDDEEPHEYSSVEESSLEMANADTFVNS